MFELVILSVIFFAAAYAAFLWMEGRRDDVLFGAFVEKSPADRVKEVRWRPAMASSWRAPLRALQLLVAVTPLDELRRQYELPRQAAPQHAAFQNANDWAGARVRRPLQARSITVDGVRDENAGAHDAEECGNCFKHGVDPWPSGRTKRLATLHSQKNSSRSRIFKG
jgi:hypothetical protein